MALLFQKSAAQDHPHHPDRRQGRQLPHALVFWYVLFSIFYILTTDNHVICLLLGLYFMYYEKAALQLMDVLC
jgi:hypothetical protein